jgi:cell fate (sporulation/competence/biofilm development) regulator YlbF (YheA/YmcA/DUF963 family)
MAEDKTERPGLAANSMDETLRAAAQQFGQALAASTVVSAYRSASTSAAEDEEAQRLKAELEEVYDGLSQRQAAGEILSQGELDAYYELEQRVRQHSLLARRDQDLEKVRDFFSEAHWILSSELGINFIDLAND